jgi:hypothetical protein
VLKAHKDHPGQLTIETELLENNQAIVMFKASVCIYADQASRCFTGHAIEFHDKKNERAVNFASAVENCETSAIGRALAAAGYLGSEYASANEMENIPAKAKRRASGNSRPPAPKPEQQILNDLPF